MKELVNEFEAKFECSRENTEKYKNLLVAIEKELTEIDEDGNESVVTISYKITYLDSANLWQHHYQILLIITQKEFK